MNKEQLTTILELHEKWLKNIEGGERADLRNANLRDANLRYANLRGANLCDADLYNANLCGADLRNANLCGADLRNANLRDANLRYANLRGANLCDAYLRYANLCDANLRYAYLCGADLYNANLCGADLYNANLCGADLYNANLCGAKEDLFAKLSLAKNEAQGLYDFLMRGKIDGSTYEGECACFVGSVAKVEGVKYKECKVAPNSNSPIERLFLAIREGDTPQNNQISAIVAEWMCEFMDSEGIKYPEYEIVAKP